MFNRPQAPPTTASPILWPINKRPLVALRNRRTRAADLLSTRDHQRKDVRKSRLVRNAQRVIHSLYGSRLTINGSPSPLAHLS